MTEVSRGEYADYGSVWDSRVERTSGSGAGARNHVSAPTSGSKGVRRRQQQREKGEKVALISFSYT